MNNSIFKNTTALIKSLVMIGFFAVISIAGFMAEPQTASASCNSWPNFDSPVDPEIDSVTQPTGTYNDPGILPINITGQTSYYCYGNGDPGYGVGSTRTRVRYEIVNSSGQVMMTRYWNSPWGDLPTTVRRGFEITDSVDASEWPVGDYTINAYVYNTANPEISSTEPTDTGVNNFNIARSAFTCTVQQNNATVDAGGSTSYVITTSAQGGFNSPITFSANLSPAGSSAPTVSFGSTNGRTPPGPTVATVTTQGSTPATTYGITFTGTGGGKSASCATQLQVNPAQGDFTLEISPSYSTVSNPNLVMAGDVMSYTVFANCTGAFAGPVNNLAATTAFTGMNLTLGRTSLNCGQTTTLTATTSGVPASQLSTPQNIQLRDISVSGSGSIPNNVTRTATSNLAIMIRPQVTLLVNGNSSANVTVGARPNLTWTTSGVINGNSCHASNTATDPAWNGAKNGPNGGAQNVGPMTTAGTFTYSIYCDGYNGSISPVSSVQITVGNAPSFACSATPSSQSVNPGSAVTINVDVTSFNGYNSPVTFTTEVDPGAPRPPTVSLSGNPQNSPYNIPTVGTVQTTADTAPGPYQIRFIGNNGISCAATVNVNELPPQPLAVTVDMRCDASPTGSFTSKTCTLPTGTVGYMSWYSTSATRCEIDNSLGQVSLNSPPGGLETKAITQRTRYTITCTGAPGSTPDTDFVDFVPFDIPIEPGVPTVDMRCDATATGGFSGKTCTVPNGSLGYMTWTTTNAERCDLAPGVGNVAPNRSVPGLATPNPITGRTQYTITCYNSANESRSDSVVFDVPALPGAPTVTMFCDANQRGSFNSKSCEVPLGSVGYMTWTSTNAERCEIDNSIGSVPTSSAGSPQASNAINSTTTYTITCYNSANQSTTDSVTFTVPPVVGEDTFTLTCTPSLAVMNQGDSEAFRLMTTKIGNFNSPVHFSVKQIRPTRANMPNASIIESTNDRVPSNETLAFVSTDSSTTASRYVVVFSGTGGGITRDCEVELDIRNLPGQNPEPPIVTTDNSQCGRVVINWAPAPTGPTPTGYVVYRGNSSNPDVGSWADISGMLPANARSYTDGNAAANSNYYKVIAYNGSASSEPQRPAVLGNLRSCDPNIDLSDKDVTAVSGRISQSFKNKFCSSVSERAELPANAIFSVGDRVAFRINVCNSGPGEMTGIQVTDTLRNLSNPTFENLNSCVSGHSYNAANNTISFTVNNIPAGDQTLQHCPIIFTATVTAPAGGNASGLYRFQNLADIRTNQLPVKQVFTPPYPFSVTGGVPGRNEIAPQ